MNHQEHSGCTDCGTEATESGLQVNRRSLAKGAAWTVPAITAAIAAPASAATTPACPTCLRPTVGAFTLNTTVLGGNTTIATTIPVFPINIDSSACNLSLFQPAYTVVPLTTATLTWSNGATQTYSGVTAGAGTFGAISAFNVGPLIQTSSTPIPNGTGFLGAYQGTQKRPTRICFNMSFVFIGLPSIISITCRYQICFNLSTTPAGVVTLGAGNVTFAGTASGGTITPL